MLLWNWPSCCVTGHSSGLADGPLGVPANSNQYDADAEPAPTLCRQNCCGLDAQKLDGPVASLRSDVDAFIVTATRFSSMTLARSTPSSTKIECPWMRYAKLCCTRM